MPADTEILPLLPPNPDEVREEPIRPKKRRGVLRKIVLGSLVFMVLSVFGVYGYLLTIEEKVERIPVRELTSLETFATGSDNLINVLIVGVDDRSSIPDDWEDRFGDFPGRRTDVMIAAHLVPGESIQMLSIPRDLKADITGHGTNRVNAAFVLGGPDLLIETIKSETGIPIHHYIEIDFAGVGAVVDSLGGVTLDFAYPGRDTKSGFEIDAGRHTLNGEQAVAYARSRHYQVFKNGEWVGTGGGDISRTGRQQELLIAMFEQVTSPQSAFNLPTFLPTFAEQISADEALTLTVMADIGIDALTLGVEDIDNATLPVKGFMGDDGRAYVVMTDETQDVIDAFIAGEPFPELPQ